jgi:hypothetical protein
VGDRREPDRDTRRDEQQALEEIRLLFTRYRQMARHGRVTERDEHAELRASAELSESTGHATAGRPPG